MLSRFRMGRRGFLAASGTAILACSTQEITAANAGLQPIELSDEHQAAVNRRRRVVVQYDAWSQLGIDFQQWLDYRFNYADEPGSQIDSLWWDITESGYATYPSKVLKFVPQAGLEKWREQGIDWIARLVGETKKRGLEVFWSHRISEVELNAAGDGAGWNGEPHPIKQQHPDWVIKTWWKQGLWNLAVADVRHHQLSILRELAENYAFDGFQLDFARHVPCLPPGRQWELRGHVTEFVRMVRLMLLDAALKRKRQLLLAARVPNNLTGCRVDGFDIAEWSRQNLIDILTLGSRSIDCDIAGFRQVTAGRNIKLQPCHDDHHATDAYQYPPIESNANPDLCKKVGARPGPDSQRVAYHEIGSPRTLWRKNKLFAVQRRGGYPWAEGYFNRNDDALLPLEMPADGRPETLSIHIGDHVNTNSDQIKRVALRLILHQAGKSDNVDAELNGVRLTLDITDDAWKDRQIFSPGPQPASGRADHWKVNPSQKLVRLDYLIDPRACKVGENRVKIRIAQRDAAQSTQPIKLEKLEVLVDYH